MSVFVPFRRLIALHLAALMLVLSLPLGVAQAALVGSEQIIEQTGAAADRARVETFFGREDVRDKFKSMGVDPNEAAARVASLSDAEITRLADRIDGMPAGQGALGTVIGAALIVAIILFFTDLFGVTDVYPFVDRVR